MVGTIVETMRPVPEPAPAVAIPAKPRQNSRLNLDTNSLSVSSNGCFEFDRVIKSGYVEKRAQKTKVAHCVPKPA